MELWRKAFQVTIDAYYAGDLRRGADACEALLASNEAPPEIELQTRRNLAFYASPLNDLLSSVDTWPVHIPVPSEGRLLYPSIANGRSELRMLVCWSPAAAAVQHDQSQHGSIPMPLLVDFASDLDIRDARPIHENYQYLGATSLVEGQCEIAHLLWHSSAWWICRSIHDSAADHRSCVALFQLDGHAVGRRHRICGDVGKSQLQQWLPVIDEAHNSLQFVTSIAPVRVWSFSGEGGVIPVGASPGSPLLRGCRSGTQLIHVEHGWLGLVDEVVAYDEGWDTHLHRFIWFDSLWQLAGVSPPWIFQSLGTEVPLGLAKRGNDILISYGVENLEAWLAITNLSDVMRLMAAPLDLTSAQRRLRQEAAMAVAAGTLPAPAQPAPVPATSALPHSPARHPVLSNEITVSSFAALTQEWPSSESAEKTSQDLATLSRYAQEDSNDPSTFWHLAGVLTEAGRFDEAIAAFRICANLSDDAELAAWAMCRSAGCFLTLDRPLDAVGEITQGMAKHAGLGELPWLAAYATWQANRPAQAVYWAKRAIALGYFSGMADSISRGESRYPAALWEGPFDILRFALRRLGDNAGADRAERHFLEARRAREVGKGE